MSNHSTTTMIHTCIPSYMVSQELNNYAASSIQKRSYSVAMSSLVKAMKLTRDCISESSQDDEEDSFCCHCCDCKLDACIKYSTTRSEPADKSRYTESASYIHRQPIWIKPSSLQFGHSLGPLATLIVTFNMALAQHLQALDKTIDPENRSECLRKAQRLYELSYRVYDQQCDTPDSMSLWFEMILTNNLGQVYKSMNDHEKYMECTQDLMSIIMLHVDCHQPIMNSMDFDVFVENATTLFPCVCAEAA